MNKTPDFILSSFRLLLSDVPDDVLLHVPVGNHLQDGTSLFSTSKWGFWLEALHRSCRRRLLHYILFTGELLCTHFNCFGWEHRHNNSNVNEGILALVKQRKHLWGKLTGGVILIVNKHFCWAIQTNQTIDTVKIWKIKAHQRQWLDDMDNDINIQHRFGRSVHSVYDVGLLNEFREQMFANQTNTLTQRITSCKTTRVY